MRVSPLDLSMGDLSMGYKRNVFPKTFSFCIFGYNTRIQIRIQILFGHLYAASESSVVCFCERAYGRAKC